MGATSDVIDRFNRAWNDHDLEATLGLLTEDCLFDSTGPAPDGVACRGREEIAAAWEPIFDDSAARVEVEDAFEAGERFVQRWRYSWEGGHVRGIDVFVVRDGLVAEKRSYVKG